MVTTDPETSVDVSPIVVTEIMVDGVRLVASAPLEFEVEYKDDPEGPFYVLEGEFDIIEYALSRETLIDVLHDSLEIIWRDFVDADRSKVSPRAYQLGVALKHRFRDAKGAS